MAVLTYWLPDGRDRTDEDVKLAKFHHGKFKELLKTYLEKYFNKRNAESADRNDFYDSGVVSQSVTLYEHFEEYDEAIKLLKRFIMEFPHMTDDIKGAANEIREFQKILDEKKNKDDKK
jgi:hypothetical protein